MHPLPQHRVTRAGKPSNLTALLLDTDALPLRNIGRLILEGAITSKGGKTLPFKVWGQIYDDVKESLYNGKSSEARWALVLCTDIQFADDSIGGGDGAVAKSITCSRVIYQDDCNEDSQLARPEAMYYAMDMKRAETRLCRPYTSTPPLHFDGTKAFTIFLYDRYSREDCLLPDCLYDGVGVPDIIARIRGGKCNLCLESRTFCSDCSVPGFVDTLGFEAAPPYEHMVRCDDKVMCALCIGLERAKEDKKYWRRYDPSRTTGEERNERFGRFWKYLEGNGYFPGDDTHERIYRRKDYDMDEEYL
ncbi:hypothetical protein TWF696_008606 [Orbilia brochopaga]|uniref:Uncharacterized protein n=1 Tax=Orbilia brochopaga TaxID=3140254 RepID=A0AAV9UK42_9PEZI